MADAAPPPPPPPATGPPMPGAKPATVTAAGVIEIILGALVLFFSIYVLAAAGDALALVGGGATILVVVTIIQGILDVTAGVLILRLAPAGRILGIIMAAIGAAFALMSLPNSTGGALILVLIGAALRIMVIIWLTQNRAAFVRA